MIKKVETVKRHAESKTVQSARELLGILAALIIICIILTFLSEKIVRLFYCVHASVPFCGVQAKEAGQ